LCDASDTVTITVNDPTTTNINASICSGSIYTFPDGTFSTVATTNISTLLTQSGCDSVVITELTVNDIYQDTIILSICSGDSLLAGGSYQNQPGIYADHLNTLPGCDSTIVTDLRMLPTVTKDTSFRICEGDSMFLGGDYQTIAGSYYDTLLSHYDCDSIVTSNLVLNPTYFITLDTSICAGDSFYFNGFNYSTSGIYQTDLTHIAALPPSNVKV